MSTDEKKNIQNLTDKMAFAPFSRVGGAIKVLPDVLKAEETTLKMAYGYVKSDPYLIAVTSKRVLLLHKGLLGGLQKHSIPYKQISDISMDKGYGTGTLNIFTAGGKKKIKGIPFDLLPEIVETIEDQILE